MWRGQRVDTSGKAGRWAGPRAQASPQPGVGDVTHPASRVKGLRCPEVPSPVRATCARGRTVSSARRARFWVSAFSLMPQGGWGLAPGGGGQGAGMPRVRVTRASPGVQALWGLSPAGALAA